MFKETKTLHFPNVTSDNLFTNSKLVMVQGAPRPPWEQAEKAKSKPKSTAEKVKDLKTKISQLEETVKKLKNPITKEARIAARKEIRNQIKKAQTDKMKAKDLPKLINLLKSELSIANIMKYSRPALRNAQRKLSDAKRSLNEVSAGSTGAKNKAKARIMKTLRKERA